MKAIYKNKVQNHSKFVVLKLFTTAVNLLLLIGDQLLQMVDCGAQ